MEYQEEVMRKFLAVLGVIYQMTPAQRATLVARLEVPELREAPSSEG